MNKRLIRLTESDIHRIVKESVNRVLREGTLDVKSIEAELSNSFGDAAMLSKQSSDDMVTIISQSGAVNPHELDTVMQELGYVSYKMTPKAYDAHHFIHYNSLDKYHDDDASKRIRTQHGFDF